MVTSKYVLYIFGSQEYTKPSQLKWNV